MKREKKQPAISSKDNISKIVCLPSYNLLSPSCNKALVREATSNIYEAQFNSVMRDQILRFKFMFGELDWKLESGESIKDGEITMFVNLWANKEVVLPMIMTFKNTEDTDVLVHYWRRMFNDFIRITNEGRVFSELTRRLVELRAKSKKNTETSSDIQKVEESRSKRLR